MGSASDSDELADLLLAELESQDEEANEGSKLTPIPSPTLVAARSSFDGSSPFAKKAKKATSSALTRGGSCPPHPGFIGQICIRCGALKGETSESEARIASSGKGLSPSRGSPPSLALRYIHHGLEVSQDEAARLRKETVQKSLESRRLFLILDLDHTLLHSTRAIDLMPEEAAVLMQRLGQQDGSNQELYHLPYMQMWTKLRPGLRQFLAEAKDLYDLHVFTMGDKDYAAGMAALLDPEGKLFGGRVASSSDASGSMVKDIDVLLGEEKMVVILDDTAGVWPKHQDNLIQVERYIYFPSAGMKLGGSRQSFFELDGDEDPDSGALSRSLRILREIHKKFFDSAASGCSGGRDLHEAMSTSDAIALKEGWVHSKASNSTNSGAGDKDVRVYLRDLRSTILDGCCILFSRVMPQQTTDPSSHPLWKLALQLGAKCVTQQEDDVTHVVATGKTAKCQWATKTNRFAVSPDWLWCSGKERIA